MTIEEVRKLRDWNRLCASDDADGPMSKRGHREHADAVDALLAVYEAARELRVARLPSGEDPEQRWRHYRAAGARLDEALAALDALEAR